jgi:hypothetical protein
MPGLIQRTGIATCDRSDVLLTIGDGCACGFRLGDQSTLAACNNVQDCDVVSWSAGSVTFNLRQGPFISISGLHLYWSDIDGNWNHVGQFT